MPDRLTAVKSGSALDAGLYDRQDGRKMSDLYLELRSRIAVVAEKTHVGAARLQEAQSAVGLSNEALARKIPVSEKTWRRWKHDGAIPTAVLPAVAAALRLELHEINPNGADVQVASPLPPELAAEVAESRVLLEAIADALGLDAQELLRAAALRGAAPDRGASGLPPPAEDAQAV